MQKNAEQDPKAKNKSRVSVPSKGNSHLKKKLGQGLPSSKARILKVFVDYTWGIVRSLHQKEKALVRT